MATRGLGTARIGFVSVFVAWLAGEAACRGGEDPRAALVAAARMWQLRMSALHGDYRIEIRPSSSESERPAMVREGSFWVTDGRYKYSQTEGPARASKKLGTLIYINAGRGTLVLQAESPGKPFRVQNWDDSEVVKSAVWRGFWDLLESPFSVMGISPENLLNTIPARSVEIVGNVPNSNRAGDLISIKVTTEQGDVYDLTADRGMDGGITHSRLFSHQLGDRVVWDATVEYQETGGVLLPSRVLLRDHMGRTRDCRFKGLAQDRYDQAFFTAEYHKVDFHPESTPSPRELLKAEEGQPAVLILGLILIACIACGVGFAFWRVRAGSQSGSHR